MKRILIFVLAVTPMFSATLERLSLDDLIAKSTVIVRGKVGETWGAMTGNVIYTHYRIQVSERFKGPIQKTVEVMVPGGAAGKLHQTAPGSPSLQTGDEFVFFLWTNKSGITWIMGLTQGLFALPGAAGDDPVLTRAANRELMLDPATARPVKDSILSMKLSELRARINSRLGVQGAQ